MRAFGPPESSSYCYRQIDRALQVLFEFDQFRRDGLFRLVFSGQHIRSLQSVSGDAKDSRLIRQNSVALVLLSDTADGHAASGFGEDAVSLRERLAGSHDLGL